MDCSKFKLTRFLIIKMFQRNGRVRLSTNEYKLKEENKTTTSKVFSFLDRLTVANIFFLFYRGLYSFEYSKVSIRKKHFQDSTI